MSLVLTEDQRMLKQSAADFVKKESPLSRIRELRDGEDPDGFSRALWAQMAALGWPGILVPEAYGGLGMGQLEMACVLEECGRNLVPEPLLSTVLLGANAVLIAGDDAHKEDMLPRVVDGSLLLALAYHERRSRYDPCAVATTAERRGSGWVLSGEKTLVFDGHVADRLIVSARTGGAASEADGISLFVVEAGSAGLEVVRQSTVDLRNAAVVRMRDLELPSSALLGVEGQAGPALEAVIDRATAGLCAEMLGASSAAFEMTLEYLKTRKQFGALIGTFQALKHRAAKMFVELELARSAVLGACEAIDGSADNACELVSVAKARCSDAAVLIGYEGIQMHGGIGMTDEHDIGFYAKRARAAELTFGDAAHHRARFAALRGF
jgi:alkylation response protein AidB-like acyl-CoA dehydrogenase